MDYWADKPRRAFKKENVVEPQGSDGDWQCGAHSQDLDSRLFKQIGSG